jgi:hypothetical protein
LFDTRNAESLFSDRRAIFIMDANGSFFASREHNMGDFHHSSLAAGAPVAAAGELEVIDGKLVTLSDKSGHYRPTRIFTNQAIDQLKENLISFEGVTLDLDSSRLHD